MMHRAQTFCGLSGVAAIILIVLGMGPIADLTPPPAPSISALEVTAQLQGYSGRIQQAMVLADIGVALSIMFVVGISMELRRIETRAAPFLSYLQLTTGVTASLLLMLPAMVMSVAAFRPDRSPDISLLRHDLATFFTFLPFSVATLAAWVIGVAVLSDGKITLIVPRWSGTTVFSPGSRTDQWAGSASSKMARSRRMAQWVGMPTILVAPWYLLIGAFLIRRGMRLDPHLDSNHQPPERVSLGEAKHA